MAGEKTNAVAAVRKKIKDTSTTPANQLLLDAEIEDLADEAVRLFSQNKPYENVHAATGDGTSEAVSMPSDWAVGFSVIREVEFPQGKTPPEYMEEDQWRIIRETNGTRKFYFLGGAPGTTEVYTITYTIPHTMSDSEDTTDDHDKDAIYNLLASLCCKSISSRFAQDVDNIIAADSVDRQSAADRWRTLSNDFRKLYNDHMGIKGDEQVGPVGAMFDWDMKYPWGVDRLTHPKRYR